MGCLFFFFFLSSLITPHSIFITHHLSLQIPKFSQPHPFDTRYSVTLFQKKKKKSQDRWLGAMFQEKKNPKSQILWLKFQKLWV